MKTFNQYITEMGLPGPGVEPNYGDPGYPTQEELRQWIKWISSKVDSSPPLTGKIYQAIGKIPYISFAEFKQQSVKTEAKLAAEAVLDDWVVRLN